MIEIIGLGPGAFGQLPVENLQRLQEAENLWLRTEQHPVVEELKQRGVNYRSFDDLYEQAEDFSVLYEEIFEQLKEMAAKGKVSYAVPGNPTVAEQTVMMLLGEPEIETRVYPAMSGIEAVLSTVGIDPMEGKGVLVADAMAISAADLDPRRALLVLQVYSRHISSDLKLTLMEAYPDEQQVCVVRAAGVPGRERKEWLPLFQLDRLEWVDYLTSIFIPAGTGGTETAVPLDPLTAIMAVLRGEQGCPWDKQQDHHSLKRYVVEEAYEVADAIDGGNMYKLCDELGDLLLQVVFHAQIASEQSAFDMNDVISGIVTKMIRRHPHVFGDGDAHTPDQVVSSWEAIKLKERKGKERESIINVPLAMPSLMLAEKVQRQAARVGFDWDEPLAALPKIEEELKEVKAALALHSEEETEKELGDLLFAVVNVCRLLKFDPEEVLKKSVNKFINRFRYMEELAKKAATPLQELSLEQMEGLWQESKNIFG